MLRTPQKYSEAYRIRKGSQVKTNVEMPAQLVRCPKCYVVLSPRNLDKHARKVHSAQAEQLKARPERGRIAAKAEAQHLVSIFSCPDCKKGFMVREMKAHFLNAHRRALPPSLVAAIGESALRNKFGSKSERDAHWKKREGPIRDEPPGEDVFAKSKVVSGGAFGLGRNRRN